MSIHPSTARSGDPGLAGRAIGALFMSIFGGLWISFWAADTYSGWAWLAVVGPTSGLLCVTAVRLYRRNASALSANSTADGARRTSRQFIRINAMQWVAIGVVALALWLTDHAQWILPATIAIIGLHFLPLGRLFHYAPHYVSGLALMVHALTYPRLASAGPASAVGALGVGLILWMSAAWAIFSPTQYRPTR
jgi:hypothetical protein